MLAAVLVKSLTIPQRSATEPLLLLSLWTAHFAVPSLIYSRSTDPLSMEGCANCPRSSVLVRVRGYLGRSMRFTPYLFVLI